jgi:hypothetical protein
MTNKTDTASLRKTARIAGFLYLILFVAAPFSMIYIPNNMIVPGDAWATANNIMASEGLFRLGIVGDSIIFLTEIVLVAILYVLLKQVSNTLSLVMAFSRLGEALILGINLLNHLFVLQLLSGAAYLTVFEPDQLNALVLLFLNAHNSGVLISELFFSLHLFFLGYLLFKSGYFPRILGILLICASAGYLIESFGNFLFPNYDEIFSRVVLVLGVIGELPFMFWLLIKGVKDQPRGNPAY